MCSSDLWAGPYAPLLPLSPSIREPPGRGGGCPGTAQVTGLAPLRPRPRPAGSRSPTAASTPRRPVCPSGRKAAHSRVRSGLRARPGGGARGQDIPRLAAAVTAAYARAPRGSTQGSSPGAPWRAALLAQARAAYCFRHAPTIYVRKTR